MQHAAGNEQSWKVSNSNQKQRELRSYVEDEDQDVEVTEWLPIDERIGKAVRKSAVRLLCLTMFPLYKKASCELPYLGY